MSRARVQPGDVPVADAARRMGLTIEQFETCKNSLFDRGFPKPDITTGLYDLDAIDAWRRQRNPVLFGVPAALTPQPKARDAREKLRAG